MSNRCGLTPFEFVAFIERGGDHSVVAILVCVLAIQREGADRPLDGVRVELYAAIVHDAREAVPAAGSAADCLGLACSWY